MLDVAILGISGIGKVHAKIFQSLGANVVAILSSTENNANLAAKQLLNEYPQFIISYYAEKHGKIITRKGTWTKPNTDIKGKHQVMNGNDVFFYWDLNAEPNKNGNQWRQATNPTRCEVA